jgi:XTP/dITP diphosphohydrolase
VTSVTFVSSNPGKAREVREVLGEFGVEVRWRRRELPEPQADDLETVVRAKLAAAPPIPGWVLVEDSGLFVPSLGGFPGVYSAHFLRIWRFGPMLELLRRRDRAAYFRTVAGLRRGARTLTFSGEVHGSIAPAPRGRHGFGFDPIFVPDGWTRTFGEVEAPLKDAISHRARAIRGVGRFLAARRPPATRTGR